MKKVYETLSINDERYTPACAVLPLLPFLERFRGKTIWCPFDMCDSKYVKILTAEGHKVIFSHKDTGGNFFDYCNSLFASDLPDFDLIITNPPYHNKTKFVSAIASFRKPFALLLPMTWLNDRAPFLIFEKIGLELMIFNRRVHFKGFSAKSQPSFGVGYFCNGILPEKIVFREINQ
jgi:hypothetical protein